MRVQCECGTEFEIEIEDKMYRSVGHYTESCMGKKHCPNPDCNKTVHVNANVYSCLELDEDINNPRIDWEDVKIGDTIPFKGNSYDIALKVTRKIKNKKLIEQEIDSNHPKFGEPIDNKINILYLRSNGTKNNLMIVVRESGFLSIPPVTSLEYATMTDEEIEFLKEE